MFPLAIALLLIPLLEPQQFVHCRPLQGPLKTSTKHPAQTTYALRGRSLIIDKIMVVPTLTWEMGLGRWHIYLRRWRRWTRSATGLRGSADAECDIDRHKADPSGEAITSRKPKSPTLAR